MLVFMPTLSVRGGFCAVLSVRRDGQHTVNVGLCVEQTLAPHMVPASVRTWTLVP